MADTTAQVVGYGLIAFDVANTFTGVGAGPDTGILGAALLGTTRKAATKSGKPDFIVSSKGTTMPTNKDFNLVDSKKPGDWFQVHNNHTDAKAPGLSHTHFPKRHNQSTTREIRTTSGSDIDRADGLLRSGQMRERINRRDKGGPLP